MSHHEDDENPVIDRLVRKHLEKRSLELTRQIWSAGSFLNRLKCLL